MYASKWFKFLLRGKAERRTRKNRVFISYRREDTSGMAGRICDRLRSRYGHESVFMDVDTIPFGQDFRTHIDDAISRCHVLLVLIGDQWLEATQNWQRRLDDPGDFVRVEIEAALARDIHVIPVLVGRSQMPGANDLPESLADLAYRNAIRVDPGLDFHVHIDRLIRSIDSLIERSSTGEGHSKDQFQSPPSLEGSLPSSEGGVTKRHKEHLALVHPAGCRSCVSRMASYEVYVTSIKSAKSRWVLSGKGRVTAQRCRVCGRMYEAVINTIPIECAPYHCPACGESDDLEYKVDRIQAEREEFTFEASITCRKCKERKSVKSKLTDLDPKAKLQIGPAGVIAKRA